MMANPESHVKYKVSVEGIEETQLEFAEFLGDVQRGIGLVSRLDYLTLSWNRAMRRGDMRGFLSATLSTISAMRMIIRLTRQATIMQQAYNVALAIGKALTPWGWVGLGVAAVGGGYLVSQMMAQPPSARPPTEEEIRAVLVEQARRDIEAERREHYRSVVPG